MVHMSDHIQQIQAQYNAIEDRILLKLNTQDGYEASAWITRRFLALLLPALHGEHPQTGESILTPQQLKNWAQRDDEHPGSESESDLSDEAFQQAYESPPSPKNLIGPEAVLLSKITFRGLDGDQPKMALEPEKGPGLELGYDPKVVQVLLHLLEKAIEKSDWEERLQPADQSLYH
jgi:hypothetical protein